MFLNVLLSIFNVLLTHLFLRSVFFTYIDLLTRIALYLSSPLCLNMHDNRVVYCLMSMRTRCPEMPFEIDNKLFIIPFACLVIRYGYSKLIFMRFIITDYVNSLLYDSTR